MTQFLVLSLSHQRGGKLKESIENNIDPANRIEIVEGSAWLVAFEGKAADLRNALIHEDGEKITMFISSLTDIAGYGSNDMIRWMDEHDR